MNFLARISLIRTRLLQATVNLTSATSKSFLSEVFAEINNLEDDFSRLEGASQDLAVQKSALQQDLKRARRDAIEEQRSLLEGFADSLGEMRDKTLRRSGHQFEALRRVNEEEGK